MVFQLLCSYSSSVVGCTAAMLMKHCSLHQACVLSALNMTHHCQIVHTLQASLFRHSIFDIGIVPLVLFFLKEDGIWESSLVGEKDRETVRSFLKNPAESRWYINVLKYPAPAHSGPGVYKVVVLISSCTGNHIIYIIDSSHYCKRWLSTCYWCLGFF